jgi:hypothetical protein
MAFSTKSIVFTVALISLIGCSSKSTTAPILDIRFEVKDLQLKFDEGSSDHSYSGEAPIIALGNPALVKQPYIVLVSVEKVKGGDPTESKKLTDTIVVVDGLGMIKTRDSADPKKVKFEKPEYNFSIKGYLPLTPNPSDSKVNQVSFRQEFSLKYEDEVLSKSKYFTVKMESYKGKGTVTVYGPPNFTQLNYLVAIKADRVKGQAKLTPGPFYFLVPVIHGFGTFETWQDWNVSVSTGGKRSDEEAFEMPEYKIDILGYQGSHNAI